MHYSVGETRLKICMNRMYLYILLISISACATPKLQLPVNPNNITGTAFYEQVNTAQWKVRDSVATEKILSGAVPSFLRKLIPIKINGIDSNTGKSVTAIIYVMPDYLSIGTNTDWARIPLTPLAAQPIADSLNCFLPTRKLVDEIYKAATVKLAPVPMYIHRDSSITMWQHHLIIEGQRKNRQGLVAGIKKDVVITDMLTRSAKKNRVAIYGWHLLNGKAIQPLYTGHVDWYADYSHGIRLAYNNVKLNGSWVLYTDIMKNKGLRHLISDENFADVYRY
jgi:hypothetical protein